MRKFWLRLHRYLGLTAALFLLLAGLTGAIIAYQQELDAWLNPHLFNSPGRGPLLTTGELLARLQQTLPQYRVVTLPLQREAGVAVRVTVRPAEAGQGGDADELFIDPVDGKLLGGRVWGACCFERQHLIPFIYVLHYSLHLPGEVGLWLMGGVAVIWLLECFLGFYLTLPKPASNVTTSPPWPPATAIRPRSWLQRWALAWRIKPGAGVVRFNFDVHRAGGLWLSGLMLIMSVSAISLNLPDAVFEPVVSLFSPFTPSPFDAREQRAHHPPVEAAISFTDILQHAADESAARGWRWPQTSIFYNADFGIFGVGFGGQQGLGPRYLYYDGVDGAFLGDYVPGTGTAADVFEAWQWPLHSGEILGFAGRVAVSLLGLAVCALVVTGLMLWLAKQKARRQKSKS